MSHISDARAQEIGELNQRIDELEEDLIHAARTWMTVFVHFTAL